MSIKECNDPLALLFFFLLLVFSCHGKVNTHPLCPLVFFMETVELCIQHLWFYCPDCHARGQRRQVSISGWALCKQMCTKTGKESRKCSWVHTYKLTHVHAHTHIHTEQHRQAYSCKFLLPQRTLHQCPLICTDLAKYIVAWIPCFSLKVFLIHCWF